MALRIGQLDGVFIRDGSHPMRSWPQSRAGPVRPSCASGLPWLWNVSDSHTISRSTPSFNTRIQAETCSSTNVQTSDILLLGRCCYPAHSQCVESLRILPPDVDHCTPDVVNQGLQSSTRLISALSDKTVLAVMQR